MAAKKLGLGRGLDALLVGARSAVDISTSDSVQKNSESSGASSGASGASGVVSPSNASSTSSASNASSTSSQVSHLQSLSGLMEIALENLQPGQYQPRQKMQPEELESLANSIRTQGVLQPLVVRHHHENKYEIIAGERRFRAAALAGLTKVPVIVKQVSDENALSIALIENIQRENLNALEEAMALERLIKEFKLTHIEVAEAVGKSRTTITNSLRLLTLTDDVKILLERGEIEAGHAKVLLGLRGQEQSEIARLVVARGLSVRETERLIAKRAEDSEDHFPKRHVIEPNVKRLQMDLSEKLGAKVEILQGNQGKGKLVICYNTLEELEGILDHIQ